MSDYIPDLERMRMRRAVTAAYSAYQSSDVDVMNYDEEESFVEKVDGGYWVEARVWVPLAAIGEMISSEQPSSNPHPAVRRRTSGHRCQPPGQGEHSPESGQTNARGVTGCFRTGRTYCGRIGQAHEPIATR